MSDQHVIVDELVRAANAGEITVLVSVVRTAGSTYRGVGARMIVRGDDSTTGLLSGGCLEADLIEHARRVRAAGTPDIVLYDTSSGDDFVWGLGLGCNGLVEVLLEPLPPTRAQSLSQLLGAALATAVPTVLATVIRSSGDGAPSVGERMLIDSSSNDVTCDGAWDDLTMLCDVRRAAIDGAVNARRGMTQDFSLNGAEVQVAFELVTPRVDIVLCGSGPDAGPVARMATELGWTVTVVDHRSAAFTVPGRFSAARVVECPDATRLADVVDLTPRTAVVVMSHSYERDLDYLDALATAGVGYIGILGPRTRTDRMLADLTSRGRLGAAALRDSVYAPIGLDIGGDGPEAIALSIVAEISAVVSGRPGSHLRDRSAPIHGEAARIAHV